MINKRLLIFSNNALSESNSNGRTLLNFLKGNNPEKIAQFYLQSSEPDFSACKNYFYASDSGVVKAFLKQKSAGKVIEEDKNIKKEVSATPTSGRKIPRNPITMLVRNFFWNRKGWRKDLNKWIDVFSPECVLLQAGDAPFLYNIALETARKYNIPLMIYNSEDYYFKDYNYFRNSGVTGVFYPAFKSVLKKSVKNVMDYAAVSVYISEDLKETYDKAFQKNSVAIYTATDVEPAVKTEDKPIFSYLGNLGLDRHIGLIKIAKALNHINPEYKLDVYGKIPNDKVQAEFDACDALDYKGLVSYDMVKEVISQSMLVFHTESFDEFYCKDICHGFTTKIADSLASGTCFVVFAPEMLSCTKYILKNECGCAITDESDLEIKLSDIINDKEQREIYIKNAFKMVDKNHNAKKNIEKMTDLINNL